MGWIFLGFRTMEFLFTSVIDCADYFNKYSALRVN